ncbi:MAG: hypothetical protein MHM6MM_009519, partial [Cercozoa sp. M6MM]
KDVLGEAYAAAASVPRGLTRADLYALSKTALSASAASAEWSRCSTASLVRRFKETGSRRIRAELKLRDFVSLTFESFGEATCGKKSVLTEEGLRRAIDLLKRANPRLARQFLEGLEENVCVPRCGVTMLSRDASMALDSLMRRIFSL